MTVQVSCHDNLTRIASGIKSGLTVVYPTDTVYGLGSNPESEKGVSRCFELKIREESKPMPVLFSSFSKLQEFVELNEQSKMLAERFWPGQLTLIVPLKKSLPSKLTAGSRNLAVRIPRHACATDLIESCGGALIGTSANISGDQTITEPDDPRLEEFCLGVDFFVKGQCGGSRKESTIVDLTKDGGMRLVRDGAVPYSDIEKLLSENQCY